MKRMRPRFNLLLATPMIFLLAVGCIAKPTPPPSSLDLVPFQEMAADAACSEEVNKLFLIDDALVFWEIKGACADAAYSFILFGSSPDELLCRFNDSIAGPMKECMDTTYQTLFEMILDHSEEADLGLGSEHTVQPIPF